MNKRLFLSRAVSVQIESSGCRPPSAQVFCCRDLMFVQAQGERAAEAGETVGTQFPQAASAECCVLGAGQDSQETGALPSGDL